MRLNWKSALGIVLSAALLVSKEDSGYDMKPIAASAIKTLTGAVKSAPAKAAD